MRFLTAVTLAAAAFSPAAGRSFFGGQDVVALDNEEVPGESPLEFCPGFEQKDGTVEITKVDLLPNPPEAGATLVIEAEGVVHQEIEEGAYINLSVKYGLIKLVNTKADFCEQIKNVDMECPINEGKLIVTKSVELPSQIPPGKYTVLADVFTKDDKHITCLTAVVFFKRGGAVSIGSEL